MRQITLAFAASVLIGGLGSGRGQDLSTIVVVGAGYTGTWDTEIALANPFPTTLNVLVGRLPFPCVVGTCPPPVPVTVAVPGEGQAVVLASQAGGREVSFLFIAPLFDGEPGLPIVRARAFSVAEPSRAMELPALSYGEWVCHKGHALVFPGAAKSAISYSNLSLAELGGADVSYRLDAFDASGDLVGSLAGSLVSGGFGVIVDVLKQMNVSAFDGQVRLTQIGGDGVLAGALATLGTDDSFAVSGGFNP